MSTDSLSLLGHQDVVDWRGEPVLTLADLWPESPRAVVVGINPPVRDVEAGHYYQGRLGLTAMARLRAAGLFPAPAGGGYDDDAALVSGVALTDVVKRPTCHSRWLDRAEIAHGAVRVAEEVARRRVPLLVCVVRPAAEALLGAATGPPGFQRPGLLGDTDVFRMPGPFDERSRVQRAMAELAEHLAG